MNILITGGAGFIGSTFVADCVQRGDNVIVLDLLTYAGHEENLSWINGKYQLVKGNICDQELVLKLLQENDIDAVVNFAAESHVERETGEVVGLDADGNLAPGKATLAAVITAATHSTVNVTGEARITNGVLKVKLATAIVGISSIHLLKTFINAPTLDEKTLLWQTVIHLTFVGSAIAIAVTERLTHPPQPEH